MKLPLNETALLEFNGMEGAMEVFGEVLRVNDIQTGKGDYGPWSFQKVVIGDPTGEATVSMKNRDEVYSKNDIGKFVHINSNETKKGGHKGVKVEQREYKKKDGTTATALEIIVTGNASVSLDGEVSASKPKENGSVAHVNSSAHVTKTEANKEEDILIHMHEDAKKWEDMKRLRKDSIQETFSIWMLTLMEHKIELTSEIVAAMIRVSGPNSDTLMISKLGGRK